MKDTSVTTTPQVKTDQETTVTEQEKKENLAEADIEPNQFTPAFVLIGVFALLVLGLAIVVFLFPNLLSRWR